jgi:hypothetical protein
MKKTWMPVLLDATLLPERGAQLRELAGGTQDIVLRESRRNDGAPDRIHKMLAESWLNNECALYRLASCATPDVVPPFLGAFAIDKRVVAAYRRHFYLARGVLVTVAGEPIAWCEQQLGEASTMRRVAQLLDALRQLHAIGVVHNDVKPDNMVEYDGRLRLVDFGHAQLVESSDGRAAAINTFGTAGYQPPDMTDVKLRAGGERRYCASASTDMYAVGAALDKLRRANDIALQRALDEFIAQLRSNLPSQRPTAVDALNTWRRLTKVCCSKIYIDVITWSSAALFFFCQEFLGVDDAVL